MILANNVANHQGDYMSSPNWTYHQDAENPGMVLHKSVNVMHDINRAKDKNYVIISIGANFLKENPAPIHDENKRNN